MKTLIPTLFLALLTIAGCAPTSHTPDELPPEGRISSITACRLLENLYDLRREQGVLVDCGPGGLPDCPWPASISPGVCPRTLDGVCVPAVCDPAAVLEAYQALAVANTCEQAAEAYLVADPDGCL